MPYGLRIGPPRLPADAALIERSRRIPVANISDAMYRIVSGGARWADGTGLALWHCFDGANSAGRQSVCPQGAGVGATGRGRRRRCRRGSTNAIIGERRLEIAAKRQLAGFIINGAVRDVAAMQAHWLPVFAAGVTHRGPYKNGPGEINFPIAIEGMVVEPGDIVVGDDDGLVCVPIRDAAEICEAAEMKHTKEAETDPTTESRDWVDAALQRLAANTRNTHSTSLNAGGTL